MYRYYIELRLKESKKSREEFIDLVVRYGSRGHNFFEDFELQNLDIAGKNRKKVILESDKRITLDNFLEYPNLKIECF